jgi:hypothetical protein
VIVVETVLTAGKILATVFAGVVLATVIYVLGGAFMIGPREAMHQSLDALLSLGPFGFILFVLTGRLFGSLTLVPADGVESDPGAAGRIGQCREPTQRMGP